MSSCSRAVRGCVMFKRTIEALRVCSVNMMYFPIFIVFVRPNVTIRLCFSAWRGLFAIHEPRRATLAVAPTIYELRVCHSVMVNKRRGAYHQRASLLHDRARVCGGRQPQARDACAAGRWQRGCHHRVEDSAWDEGDV